MRDTALKAGHKVSEENENISEMEYRPGNVYILVKMVVKDKIQLPKSVRADLWRAISYRKEAMEFYKLKSKADLGHDFYLETLEKSLEEFDQLTAHISSKFANPGPSNVGDDSSSTPSDIYENLGVDETNCCTSSSDENTQSFDNIRGNGEPTQRKGKAKEPEDKNKRAGPQSIVSLYLSC
ncbi:hypothetical protein NHQ30_002513 [Ciborinia camelliae]|nr:hypothetical protein NHQ30_002513 [Ciborinia camelliae]